MIRLNDLTRAADKHPAVADGILALAVYVLTLMIPSQAHGHEVARPTVQSALVGAGISAMLVFRRRYPVQVLCATMAGMVGYLARGGVHGPLILAPMIAIYTVAGRSSRRGAVRVGLLSAVILTAAGLFGSDHIGFNTETFGLFAWSGLAAAVGDAVRSRRAFVAAIEERAQRAERTREEEAGRRVIEERLRIARELHDVLAHHIALINVQAGVVAHVMDTEPDQARESLSHIREAGRSALEELRTTVGLLRQPNAPTESATESATEPAPGLHRLPDLLASFAATGLLVGEKVEGAVRELPATVDLTAYRVIQEALTNVSKHANDATADLRLDYRTTELLVEVTNTGAGGGARPGGGTGHGLLGMRERALAVGGSFAAGPRGEGGFAVRAVLPLPQDSPPQSGKCRAQRRGA